MKKYKVLHAPTTVGGNPQGQSSALAKCGVDSVSMTFAQNYFNYPSDRILWNNGDSLLVKEFKRFCSFVKSFFEFDIFHFNFGQSFFGPFIISEKPPSIHIRYLRLLHIAIRTQVFPYIQLAELKLYRLFKKPVFMTYQGSDARQGDYSLNNFTITVANQVDSNFYTPFSDEQKRRSISLLSKYCDQIYSLNPDLLWVLPSSAKFLPYSHIFLDEWQPVYTQLHTGPLRIAHAPTHRQAKGTDFVLAAIESLKQQKYNVELLLVEGLSNAEAKKLYISADILIDQLFAGWYGGLAVEAMALGKPVVVYIRSQDLQFIPSEMQRDLPFLQATSESLEDVLRHIVEMPRHELLEIAHRSRRYVEKWHDPIKIAQQLKSDYEEALDQHSLKRRFA